MPTVGAVPRSASRPALRLSLLDVALALVLAAAVQAELWWYDGRPQGVPAVTAVASAAYALSLLVRSSRPELMAGAASMVVVTQAMLGGRLTSTLSVAFVSMLVTFSIGLLLPRRRALAWVSVFLLAVWFDLLAVSHDDFGVVSDIAFTAVIAVGAPFLAGRALRDRRQRTDELERLNRELRAEREETARLAVLDERARIAREVHDVVAHSVSLMVVQAGAARHLLTRDPDRSRVALASVESVGREALHELRQTLGVLRGTGEESPADLAPQPGIAQLSALVAGTRGSGLRVTLDVDPGLGPLTPGADVAAYRIVQEALTNAVKHAPGASVAVRVSATADGVRLCIQDDGPGAADTASGGHGLRGMWERARIHGGTLASTTRPGGGFRVEAELPYDSGRVAR